MHTDNGKTDIELIARQHQRDLTSAVRQERVATRARHRRTADLLRRLATRLDG